VKKGQLSVLDLAWATNGYLGIQPGCDPPEALTWVELKNLNSSPLGVNE